VELVDEKSGWWMASDGSWYPPEPYPGRGAPVRERSSVVTATGTKPMGPRSEVKPLRYGGPCIQCGQKIPPHDRGWHDPDIKKVMCLVCWPVDGPPAGPVTAAPGGAGATTRPGPVGGTSAAAVARRRGDPRWRKGAVGEYLMSIRLQRDLGDEAVVLNDRRLPEGRANIDHLVVASSGVWVIDSKHMQGLIEHRNVGGVLSDDRRLLVGGQDRTSMTDKIYEYVIPVANLVADPAIPVNPAIVFVEGNWGSPTRILTKRPYRHQGVWILWPAALIKKIEEPGPLGPESIARLGEALDNALPPR
jgi:Nuclease-related domain